MPTDRTVVLLTGAGGRIGPHVLPAFRDRFALRLLDRRPIDAVEPTIIADLSDRDLLQEAMHGVDVV
ncbi:MAG: NAD(P)-dependent oxidoreductase, partial [Armatimonadota bacterium]